MTNCSTSSADPFAAEDSSDEDIDLFGNEHPASTNDDSAQKKALRSALFDDDADESAGLFD